MGRRSTQYILFTVLLVGMICVVLSYRRPVFLERMERMAFDWHYSHKRIPVESKDVVLVLAGEKSFAQLGAWPWPRSDHAKLLGLLGLSRVVLLDIIMPEKNSPAEDALLAQVIRTMGNVVVAGHISTDNDESRLILPYSAMYEAAADLGVTNVDKDVDGLLRFHAPYRVSDAGAVASLPLAGASFLTKSRPKVLGVDHFGLLIGDRLIPLAEDGQVWVQFSDADLEKYEYVDVYNGAVSPESFRDKIVVVGISASGASDFHTVPDFPGARVVTGVEYNAYALISLLWGDIPVRISVWKGAVLCMLAALAGCYLGWLSPLRGYVGLGLALLSLIFSVHYIFLSTSIWLDTVKPGSAMLLAFVMAQGLRYILLHRDWTIKACSIDEISNIDGEAIARHDNFPEYLEEIWDRFGSLTGISIVKSSVLEANLDEHLLPEGTSLRICRPGPEGMRYGMAVPISGSVHDREYVLLGWNKDIEESTIKTLSAVILSNAWFFNSYKEAAKRKKVLLNAINAIFLALDFRDPITGGHSTRVSSLALEIMRHMVDNNYMDPEQALLVDDYYLGALVHDVGKIGVPDSILLKKGKLTEEEFTKIKSHPRVGHDIMQAAGLPEAALDVLLHHHEKYNGKGYPDSLEGTDISIGARIVAVADVYDALTHDRPYRSGWDLGKARDFIRSKRGIDFDPVVVDVFLEINVQ